MVHSEYKITLQKEQEARVVAHSGLTFEQAQALFDQHYNNYKLADVIYSEMNDDGDHFKYLFNGHIFTLRIE